MAPDDQILPLVTLDFSDLNAAPTRLGALRGERKGSGHGPGPAEVHLRNKN